MSAEPISSHDIDRLVALVAPVHWPWPTSGGAPIREGHPDFGNVNHLAAQRDKIAEAAAQLIRDGELQKAAKLAADAWRLWLVARDPAGGRAFLKMILNDRAGLQSAKHAYVLYGNSLLALWNGETLESKASADAALEIAIEIGDSHALVLANLAIARVELDFGDIDRALTHALEARLHAQELEPEWDQAPLFTYAQVCRKMGDYEAAAFLFEQSVELNREIGDRGMVMAELENLGRMECRLGRTDDAERHFEQSAAVGFPVNDSRRVMMDLNHAMVARARGDREKLRELIDKIDRAIRELRLELGWDDGEDWEWVKASY